MTRTRKPRPRPAAPIVPFFLALLAAALPHGRTAGVETRPALEARPDLGLPFDAAGEVVCPYGVEVPAACTAFVEAAGGGWFVLWDRFLDTPRLFFPAEPHPLITASGSAESDVLAAARAFIDRHAELFGVDSASLAGGKVVPLDDGHLFTAYQLHEGLPVRGSVLRLRLDAGLKLRSASLRIARALPPAGAVRIGEEEAAKLAAAAGLESQFARTLQVAFPAGSTSAACAWAVAGRHADGRELEVIFSAESGRELASIETALGFDGPDVCIPGSVHGYSPPPDDIYSMAFQVTAADLYPLPEIPVRYTLFFFRDLESFEVLQSHGESRTAADGSFLMQAERLGFSVSYTLRPFAANTYFLILWPHDHPAGKERSFFADQRPHLVFNPDPGEFESFHLMTFHHLRRAELEVKGLLARHGLDYSPGLAPLLEPDRDPVAEVRLSKGSYGHAYEPYSRRLGFASDELQPRDAQGRWRKVVPTIIYHEFGHEFFRGLTDGAGERQVNEGLSDAFSGFVARVPTVGFVDPATPNADRAARDLRRDNTAWPGEARRAVAGAFWELWESTLFEPDHQGKDPTDRTSPFAFGLLARWLAGKRLPGPFIGEVAVEYGPAIGAELFAEADHPRLGGNGNLRDGVPHQEKLQRAFGRRNLFFHAFIRGDANGSGTVDISDALSIFGFLFLGGSDGGCPDALDTDDSGTVEITDGIYLLVHLFAGGRAPPRPNGGCGWDVTPADGLGCWSSPCGYFGPRR
jgi:hypothetical protein